MRLAAAQAQLDAVGHRVATEAVEHAKEVAQLKESLERAIKVCGSKTACTIPSGR